MVSVVQINYADWLDEYESENGPSSYSYKAYFDPILIQILQPRSEVVPEEYDFVWMNFWGYPAEEAAGQEAFAESGQEIQASFRCGYYCSGDPISHDVRPSI